MSQTLNLKNFGSLNILDQTQLTAAAPAASSSLTVDNAQDFSSGYLLLGPIGSKSSELLANTPVTGGTAVALTGTTALKHNQFEPVYALYGNKLRIYRAANTGGSQPVDGSFSLLATVDIDPNDASTSYTDGTGGGNYWYKYTFYNSTTTNETDLASSTAVRGSFSVNYCSIDEIRQEAGFTRNVNITDDMIDSKLQAAMATINSTLIGTYTVPFTDPINPLISNITMRLAAGWLLLEQYGHFDTMNTNNGQKKVDSVMNDKKTGDLDKLQEGILVLTDSAGAPTTISGTDVGGSAGWPNDTTAGAETNSGGGDFLFKIGGIRGYKQRDY